MTFPTINNIEDVLPSLTEDFYVAEKEGYKLINYRVCFSDTFPEIQSEEDAIKREFRGIIFSDDGKIVRRPFQKFFNMDERVETKVENIDFSKPHMILDKLDGSMVTPFEINGRIIWGSKMGETHITPQVEDYIIDKNNYVEFFEYCKERDWSPTFEWCTRKQRIVLDYQKEELVLTAVRHLNTGEYISYQRLEDITKVFDIPLVKSLKSVFSDKFYNYVKNMTDVEGYVVRFDDGTMFKIKTDWYVKLHHTKSALSYEKNVALLIVDECIDDLKPILMDDDLKDLMEYEESFFSSIMTGVNNCVEWLFKIQQEKMSRKDFALSVMPTLSKIESSIIFTYFDRENLIGVADDVFESIKVSIRKSCNSNRKYEEMRNDFLKECIVWKSVNVE